MWFALQDRGGHSEEIKIGEPSRKRGGSDSCYRKEEKRQKAEKWSDYLKIAGLYESSEKDNYQPYEFGFKTLKNIGKNTRHNKKHIFKNIVIPNFNLKDIVAHARKVQPLEADQKGFEAANESTLHLIDDQNVFIRDNSGNS